jgi:DNA-binding transcriptional ArsR family regulator
MDASAESFESAVIERSRGVSFSGLPHPLPEALVEMLARRFHVIGEPMRIRLLDRLRDGEATVHELAEGMGASQQNVSRHLAMLHDAGILARRKDGTQVVYRVVDEGVFELCESVCGSLQRGVVDLHAILAGVRR